MAIGRPKPRTSGGIYNPNQTKELMKEINENYPYLKLTTKRG